MIYDVFSQPRQAMVMVFFGLAAGLGYELLRLLRPPGCGVWFDLFPLLLLQVCLGLGLFYAARGEVRLYALILFFLGMLLVRWAFRPLFTEILQRIRKKQFPSG